MSSDRNTSSSAGGGIGFTGALFLVLLVLKLTGVIDWSWWWVTAPLWIPFVLAVAVLSVVLVVVHRKDARRLKRLEQRAAVQAVRQELIEETEARLERGRIARATALTSEEALRRFDQFGQAVRDTGQEGPK